MKGKSVLDAPQKYVRSNDLAQSLHVSPLVLSRLSGSVTIDAGNKLRVDIGKRRGEREIEGEGESKQAPS